MTVFNYDIEYGKFKAQMTQAQEFFTKLIEILSKTEDDHTKGLRFTVESEAYELLKCKNISDLQAFQPLTQFLKHFYKKELAEQQDQVNSGARQLPRIRTSYDIVSTMKDKNILGLVRSYFMTPSQFIDNLSNSAQNYLPPQSYEEIDQKLECVTDPAKKEEILNSIRQFAAIELSVQPYFRKHVKIYLYENAILRTQPTEEGVKIIDIFSPSYRVKHISGRPLKSFKHEKIDGFYDTTNGGFAEQGDLFLDILQNESKGLI